MCNRITGLFFFHEATISADVYLDLSTEYVAPQLIDFQLIIIFHQDGAPPLRAVVPNLCNGPHP